MNQSLRSTMIDRAIGARLRAFRLQRKLSQSVVAKTLGVTFQQVQKYEKGTNRVSGSRIVKLCELLNVKPEQLLGNGTGVFHSEPDLLVDLFKNKDMVRMFVEIAELPPTQRRAVTGSMLEMVRAFKARLK